MQRHKVKGRNRHQLVKWYLRMKIVPPVALAVGLPFLKPCQIVTSGFGIDWTAETGRPWLTEQEHLPSVD
jgi:hypothetical protein